MEIEECFILIFQWILHDWSNDQCLKLLKNCYDALPEFGKVIIVESVVPEFPDTDLVSKNIFKVDINMAMINIEGKERTVKEFEALARGAGFMAMKLICCVYGYWVIEFYKMV